MTSGWAGLPTGLDLWSGFLDRLPARDAVDAVRLIEQVGIATIWLQEYSGVDPFIRAALYHAGTDDLTVALGVATIMHAIPRQWWLRRRRCTKLSLAVSRWDWAPATAISPNPAGAPTPGP